MRSLPSTKGTKKQMYTLSDEDAYYEEKIKQGKKAR